jgi:hypothetical protein
MGRKDNPYVHDSEETFMISGKSSPRHAGTLILLLASFCVASSDDARAEDLPVFRPGLWEFTRSMDDNSGMYRQTKFTRQKCAAPTADLRKASEKMSAQGCSQSPLLRIGDSYEGTSTCQVFGIQMESHTVLTAAGDGAYRRVTTARGEKGSTTEEITARRLGDCPAESGGH